MANDKKTFTLKIGKKAEPRPDITPASKSVQSAPTGQARPDIFDIHSVLDLNNDGTVDEKDVKFFYADLHYKTVKNASLIWKYAISEPFLYFAILFTGFSAWISYIYYGTLMDNSTQAFGIIMGFVSACSIFTSLYFASTKWTQPVSKFVAILMVMGVGIADATANRGWLAIGRGAEEVRTKIVAVKQKADLATYTTATERRTALESQGVRKASTVRAAMAAAGTAKFKIRGRTGRVSERCPAVPNHPRCKKWTELSKELDLAEEYERVVATLASFDAKGFGAKGTTEQTSTSVQSDALADVLGIDRSFAKKHIYTMMAWFMVFLGLSLYMLGFNRADTRRRKAVAAELDMIRATGESSEAAARAVTPATEAHAAKMRNIAANIRAAVPATPTPAKPAAIGSNSAPDIESWLGTLVPKQGNWVSAADLWINFQRFTQLNNVDYKGNAAEFLDGLNRSGKIGALTRQGKKGYAGFALPV